MNTNTIKINEREAKLLEVFFKKLGCAFDCVQYSNWRAKGNGIQATYYTSGKLLLQGSNVESISKEIASVLNKLTVSEVEISFNEPYIGTDESGKGDFFGPLVIAGVQVNDELAKKFISLGIKDSKKLNDTTIMKLSAQIRNSAVHSVVVIMPEKYNDLYQKFNNLNKLLAWGHARAIENILEKSPCKYALSDKFGDESLINNALMKQGKEIKLEQRVRGESDIAVAAASIVARAEFVKRIKELEQKYSQSFSKGVNDQVMQQAKHYIQQHSKEDLKYVAKLHFKTFAKV